MQKMLAGTQAPAQPETLLIDIKAGSDPNEQDAQIMP